jgi:hypothetical protein
MFNQIKSTLSSREFQTGAAQLGAAVLTIVVSTVVSKTVNAALNTGIETLMDKIHGPKVVETPAE